MHIASKKTIVDIAAELKLVPLARQAWGNHPILADCTTRIAGHLYGAYINGEHLVNDVIKAALLAYRSEMQHGGNETEAYITNLLLLSTPIFKHEFSAANGHGKTIRWEPLRESYVEFSRSCNNHSVECSPIESIKDDLYYACMLSSITMPLMVTNLMTSKQVVQKKKKHA